jgi:multiple sugar transport system substrate-binding protein
MMNRRSLLTGMTGIGVAAMLGGCSSQGGDKGGEGDAEKAEITFGLWDTIVATMVRDNLPAFNKQHPGIRVTIQDSPWNGYWSKLQTQASSGTLPDVIWMNGPNFQLYAGNGHLEPLDSMVDDKTLVPSNFPRPLVDLYTLDGKLYGVPGVYNATALWYNTAIFEAHGEEPPNETWTWDTVRDTASRIAKKGKGTYGIAFALGSGEVSYYNTIHQAGGFVLSEDKTKSGYDRPESIEGLEFFASMMRNGSAPTINQLTDQDPDDWFGSGKTAMLYGGATSVAPLAESPQAKNIKLVHLPKKVNSDCVVHGVGTSITSSSKNKAAARAFCGWVASKEFSELLGGTGSTIPPFAGSEKSYLAARPEFDLQVLIDAAKTGYPYPCSKNTTAWSSLEPKVLGDLWAGKTDATTAGKELAKQMNAQLAKG